MVLLVDGQLRCVLQVRALVVAVGGCFSCSLLWVSLLVLTLSSACSPPHQDPRADRALVGTVGGWSWLRRGGGRPAVAAVSFFGWVIST